LVEGVVVPNIEIDGAFDEALKDVVGVLHIASPLANPVILSPLCEPKHIIMCL
jgi:hypothetical protein